MEGPEKMVGSVEAATDTVNTGEVNTVYAQTNNGNVGNQVNPDDASEVTSTIEVHAKVSYYYHGDYTDGHESS